MNIAERIHLKRKEKKMSQRQLADSSGVSFSSIRRYESGEREPRTSDASKIAVALDVDVDYLLNGGYRGTLNLDGLTDEEILEQGAELHAIVKGLPQRANEVILLHSFYQLNSVGQGKVIDTAQDLAKIPDYQKELEK